MTRTKNFLRQNVFKIFLKTTFFHDSCQPDHYDDDENLKITGYNEHFINNR